MASCVPSSQSPGDGFRHVRVLARSSHPQLFVSKQSLKKADVVAAIRLKRESCTQSLGFASRPFVLCGLPIRQPKAGVLLHERRNGRFHLQVTGHPSFGLPWGQDRLVPLFLATLAVFGSTGADAPEHAGHHHEEGIAGPGYLCNASWLWPSPIGRGRAHIALGAQMVADGSKKKGFS